MIGLVTPETNWQATVEWAIASLEREVQSLWCVGPRDPIVVLSALSQEVSNGGLGLLISSLANRPPLMAAKQLLTLDQICGGRLEIGVDAADTFQRIQAADDGSLSIGRVWSLDGQGDWPRAVLVESTSVSQAEEWANKGVECVITRTILNPVR